MRKQLDLFSAKNPKAKKGQFTPEDWQYVRENWIVPVALRFRIDGFDVVLGYGILKNRISRMCYVNHEVGMINLAKNEKGEFSEIGTKFYQTHTTQKYSTQRKKEIALEFSKAEIKRFFPDFHDRIEYKQPLWFSALAFKAHIERNCYKIQLIRD